MRTTASSRLPPAAGQVLDRGSALEFELDGRRYSGFKGDTVASALYAAGVRVFSRSFKYHRPRGLLCANGRCPNCLCSVDGTPNVRTCTTPLQPGMRVRSQNAWPSLEHDAMAIVDKMSPLLPVGFYYKTFIRPAGMWPVYEKVLRRAAGLGSLDTTRESRADYIHEYRHTDVAVVGGGPAGLTAALEAARLGAQVTLIDEEATLGGHLRYRTGSDTAGSDSRPTPGYERARALAAEVDAAPNIDVLSSAAAIGVYEGNLLGIARGPRLIELRYRALVVATGQQDRPLVFRDNDLPGIMLASGAQRLMHLYGVRPGERAVVATTGDAGLEVAEELRAAGALVVSVADARTDSGLSEALQALRKAHVPVLAGHVVSSALGGSRLSGVILSRLDGAGARIPGADQQVACDLLVLATGADPLVGLLTQAGGRLQYRADRDRFVLTDAPEGVFAAGQVSGASTLDDILSDGWLAGAEAAILLGLGDGAREAVAAFRSARGRSTADHPAPVAPALVSTAPSPSRTFVCFCEDVTEKEIIHAIDEGFDHVETLKRYTTFSMGPCQGRMCHVNAVALAARQNGVDRAATVLTTSRPPATPVELGTLAGVLHEPARLSAMHELHLKAGAEIMDLGEWKRARMYAATAAQEVRAVRERVGIIDVSSLGKLDVRGPHAGELLDFVYANRVSDLKVGRVRYAVLCDETGIVLDDGTVARMAPDRFFLSTTTSGIGSVQEWMEWWIAGNSQRVHVTNVTSARAAINLAGPRARDVLRKLTDLDLSSQAAPYLSAREGQVAGVPALLLRIGFVGELGYEMHFPSEYGHHVWNALMEAGQEFDIQPFGVEAQRILRLEKGHLIVSQDTDGLTNPFEAGMSWVVKLDKPDFVGKPSLARLKALPMQNRLVGFRMDDPTLVPEEGNAVVLNGSPVGRVTSARSSPALGASIGLAWVPATQAAEGTSILVRVDGRVASARVVPPTFYDPDGARMKA